MSSCLDISGCPFSGANECGEKERALDAHVHTHAMPPPAMNGARNLAPGSRGAVSPSGQVNSWRERSTERLLHSRQCELPFQISIFYAYTCRTCGQPDTNNRPRGSFRGLILYASFYTDTYHPPPSAFHDRLVTFSLFIFSPFDPSVSAFSSKIHHRPRFKERVN